MSMISASQFRELLSSGKVRAGKKGRLAFSGDAGLILSPPKAQREVQPKDRALKLLKIDRPKQSEDDFQIEVAELLDSLPLDWFHCPNGGKRYKSVAYKLKKMGVKSGVPDVIILNPTVYGNYSGLVIELKVGKNTMTDNQNQWSERFKKNNWAHEVAYNFETIKGLLLLYYNI